MMKNDYYIINVIKIKYKKLACFDLDHTFITTKVVQRFENIVEIGSYIMIMLKIKLSNY